MAIAVAAIRTGRTDRYCPVTQSGRELSDAQLGQILSMHPGEPVLAFDGDLAGRESAGRYEQAFVAHGRAVIVATLPAAHDPASWLATCGDAGLRAWQRGGSGIRRGVSELRSGITVPAMAGGRRALKALGSGDPLRDGAYLPGDQTRSPKLVSDWCRCDGRRNPHAHGLRSDGVEAQSGWTVVEHPGHRRRSGGVDQYGIQVVVARPARFSPDGAASQWGGAGPRRLVRGVAQAAGEVTGSAWRTQCCDVSLECPQLP